MVILINVGLGWAPSFLPLKRPRPCSLQKSLQQFKVPLADVRFRQGFTGRFSSTILPCFGSFVLCVARLLVLFPFCGSCAEIGVDYRRQTLGSRAALSVYTEIGISDESEDDSVLSVWHRTATHSKRPPPRSKSREAYRMPRTELSSLNLFNFVLSQ